MGTEYQFLAEASGIIGANLPTTANLRVFSMPLYKVLTCYTPPLAPNKEYARSIFS